ncbi:MAG TPA: ABC transporter ATP-binding protein [Candidatus Dormibacteraeota bacterium]|nr:ABC transporter ATP-binding protein [Candidatus Dormibacteraeota bacterium]
MARAAGPEPAGDGEIVLSLREVRTALRLGEGEIHPVDGVSFDLVRRQTLAIVGESGSGKSMTAASIIGLLPERVARISAGSILFRGEDLTQLSEAGLRRVRGKGIALMPQDPMTALNPSLTVGYQVTEPLRVHERASRAAAGERALALLARTGIGNPEAALRAYPHQLSGGMRQRVVLAMALICHPEVLIADEPTTALDVTTQEQIIDLLQEMQADSGLSLILITHDLGVVARIADRVLIMYAGRSAEYGTTEDIFYRPSHPYTRGLLASVDFDSYAPGSHLGSIPGAPPRLDALPSGCAFRTRCPFARAVCEERVPVLRAGPSVPGEVACHVALAGDLPPWPEAKEVKP